MQAQILQILDAPDYADEIHRGVEALQAGKLLIVPTETVYGVAGLISNPQARTALSDLRQSQAPKPFTIHVARREDALPFLGEVNDFARRMMRKLWPGPVGLIFDIPENRRREIADALGVTQSDLFDGSLITLRCVDHPVFFDIASQAKQPVALIAAGRGVQRVADLPADVLSKVETVYDAGETRFSKASTLLRVKENSYDVVRVGIYDERIIDRLLRTTFLFVCSGNTCRSPMAEAIARKFLADRLNILPDELENRGINVISAGSYAMPGARATPQAVDALRPMGLDISRHRSRPLTVELIHQADVIYTMGKGHSRAVMSLVPSASDKVQTLDPKQDIEDPIGGDQSLYTEVANLLKTLIEQRLTEENVPL